MLYPLFGVCANPSKFLQNIWKLGRKRRPDQWRVAKIALARPNIASQFSEK